MKSSSKMSTYRSVNFHELCRVCTAHTERRLNIFSADVKDKCLAAKIADCLPLKMDEKDRLPKFVCEQCLNQVEEIYNFRNICKNSQNMLNECLKQATQHSSGKVYIKDAIANSGKSLSVVNVNERQNSIHQFTTETISSNVATGAGAIPNNNTDILNTIIQSIGIQPTLDTSQVDKTQIQNFNITMDNKAPSQPTQVQYKTENLAAAQSLQNTQTTLQKHKETAAFDVDHKALTEFLKMKPNIKVTPLGKNNGKRLDEGSQQQQQQQTQQQQQQQQPQQQQQQHLQQQQQVSFQQTQQLQFQSPQLQQIFHQPEQLVQLQQQLSAPTATTTANAATIQLQQLQQQIQQFQLQQQLQQQIQQITSQLQPQQQTITFAAPGGANDMSPSKNKKPKLNFVLTSPTSQTLTASLPQLQQQPHIQLQLQSPQSQQQAAAATLFSNLAPFLQQHQQQTQSQQQTQNSANNMLQTAATPMSTQTTIMSSPNKCYLPITIKDENSDQEFVAHIDAKNFMLPTTYQLQMKLQPQIATVDGQPIMQLTPTAIPATLQLAASALNSPAFQALANNNMLQALPALQQQQLQEQQQQQQTQLQTQVVALQQQQQQQQQNAMKPPAQPSTPQQIVHVQVTNDAATSTNEQIEDFLPNNKQETKNVFKQHTYRLSQHSVSGPIEITPTSLSQQMPPPQKQQQQTKQPLTQKQSMPAPQQRQEMVEQKQTQQQQLEQKLLRQKQLQQQSSADMPRITNVTTIKQDPQRQQQGLQQQAISNNTVLPAKVAMLQKKDLTISRISNKPQTPQQQQQQQQALLKLLPTKKEDTKSNETTVPPTTQIQQTQVQRQEAIAQQLQALISTTSSQVKVARKPNTTTTAQQRQQTLLTNKAVATAATLQTATNSSTQATAAVTVTTTATLPTQNKQQQQEQDTNATTETEQDTAKEGKNQGTPAHGVGPNGTECSQCGRVFKKKEHLTQHVKLHAGLRPFKCKEDQCGKAFSRKEHLMRHEISHTGRKLFSCDICHKPFSRKDNLNKHRRIHLTTTNVYTCEICTKQFVVKAYYEEHKQMHEDSDAAEAVDTNNDKTGRAQTSNNNTSLENMQQLNRLQQQQTQSSQQAQQQQPQQQHYIQSTMTAIPPSLISTTNQPQTQQLQLVQQTGTAQYQQQQQHQQIMQLQMPTVVTTQDLTGNTFTITQSTNDPTSLKATIAGGGTHDAAVLNLPSTLANLMQLSHAQFVNTATGQIMGHIKIEK